MDLKVPRQLARACLVDLSDSVLSSAVLVLQCFIEWAVANRRLSADGSQPSRAALGRSLMQQLCDVDLPQHLLGLMSATTKKLLSPADTAPAAVSSDSSGRYVTHLLKVSACSLFLQRAIAFQPDSLAPPGCLSAPGGIAAGTELALAVLGCACSALPAPSLQHQLSGPGTLWRHVDAAVKHLGALREWLRGCRAEICCTCCQVHFAAVA